MTSRFNLVQAPPREPGHCWITKTSVGPFIDTGIDLSVKVIDRGRLYISVDALREMAQIAGLFDETEPKEVGLRKKRWYEEGYNDAMKELTNESLNRLVDHIVNNPAGVTDGAAVVAPTGHLSTAGAAIPNPENATAGIQQVDENVDGFEQQSTKSVVLEGSASLSTNPNDDGNFRL
jgi:hypothetical protein